jgi:uncharacterized protein (DUF302 family)
MIRTLAALALAGLATAAVAEVPGLVTIPSAHDVPTTVERFVRAADEKGLNVFTQIDHAAGAKSAGLELPPTTLVVFGNPKLGTRLMQCGHSVAIDLPLKVLVWQDADGRVALSYNDPAWLGERHGLSGCEEPLAAMEKAIAGLAKNATE